jgi:hypothetical protein
MEDDVEIRKARYKQMSTQELLELHAAGILGDMAYNLLESELGERGIPLPSRPKGEEPLAEVDKSDTHNEKRSCQYTMLAWISPLIGFVLLLIPFITDVEETFMGTAVGFSLVSIVAGALLTTWAFVKRNRDSNALRDAIIGLFMNALLILFTIFSVFAYLVMKVPFK